ncbi:MAG: DUF21 domain-containing protein [Prolixibacteraceae bacterium]|nr:DUF21 domain-containing protein [Prolixibacteraceae bacterium]
MGLLFVYFFLALIISFLCSIMESVLLSTPPSYLMVKQQEGHHWAGDFLNLKKHIDKPLSAILSLNTVAHTIGAAGVGAEAVKVFGDASFGIVTMEHIIETMLGLEIIDEKDTVSDMQKFARERWKTRQTKYNLMEKLINKPD